MFRTLSYFLIFQTVISQAFENKYDVKLIPQLLLENADLVIRNYNIDFEMLSIDKTVNKEHITYTFLNESGVNKVKLAAFYKESQDKISNISIKLFDKNGTLVRKFKQSDIADYPAFDGFSVKTDYRIKYADFYYPDFPYTIEFEYDKSSNHSIGFPIFTPQFDFRISIESASISVKVPLNDSLRYKIYNSTVQPSFINDLKYLSCNFSITGLQAKNKEEFNPSIFKYVPYVVFAPNKFKFGKYYGQLDTWNNFGKFYSNLNKDKPFFSDENKAKVLELVKNCKSDKEKIEVLYNHLQKTKRYVSIQIGVGGMQCFDADFVEQYGFGDCKALSNYMQAMLKVAGITSHVALVYAGEQLLEPDPNFTANLFNHAILFIPLPNDSIWLECTSETLPVGYLGSFTNNRNALITTSEGGYLKKTPKYGLETNKITSNTKVEIIDKSIQLYNVRLNLKGIPAELVGQLNFYTSPKDQEKWIINYLQINNIQDLKFKIENIKTDTIPSIKIELNYKKEININSINNQINISTKADFIQNRTIKNSKLRIENYYNNNALSRLDTMQFNYPTNLKLFDFKNVNSELNYDFGHYNKLSYLNSDNQLIIIRKFHLDCFDIKPNDSAYLKSFFDQIIRDDKQVVTFINN
ncbi:MAG: DUF3857 domain-containing protein [Bacteroidota bacterium]|nr:DUF3857 domain-containing protein [Bacteroidota bacterium]